MEQVSAAHKVVEAAVLRKDMQECCQQQHTSSCGPEMNQLSEEMLEEFGQAGASNEVFEWWTLLETRAKTQAHGSTPLPRVVRDAAVRHIETMAKQTGCQWSAFFLCIALFDAFCGRSTGGVAIESIPAVCAAIVGIVKKEDDASVYVHYDELALQASQFALWLQSSGYPVVTPSVTVKGIQRTEHQVLNALGWIVQIPTIETWARAVMSRVHVLTRRKYAQQIGTIWQSNLVHTMRLVLLKRAQSSDFTWGSAACGLFALGLIGAGLLPSAMLKNNDLDTNAWDQLLAEGQVPGMKLQPAVLSTEESATLLKQLMIATGREHASLCADCTKVANVMQEAMAEIRQRRGPQPRNRASV